MFRIAQFPGPPVASYNGQADRAEGAVLGASDLPSRCYAFLFFRQVIARSNRAAFDIVFTPNGTWKIHYQRFSFAQEGIKRCNASSAFPWFKDL